MINEKIRPIGVHTSIAGGIYFSLERASELGCTAMQIFSHNPRGWYVKPLTDTDISRFRELQERLEIFSVIHTSYLINLAAKTNELLDKSIQLMKVEMDRAEALGIEYVVLHTGSASGVDPIVARAKAIDSLRMLSRLGSWHSKILLENTAGEKGDITSSMKDLGTVINEVGNDLIGGVCIDTCHAFAAGYNITSKSGVDQLAKEVESHIGCSNIKLIHLNDAKGDVGSGLDRHENIGEGKIGSKGLGLFVNHRVFRDLPLILETPKKHEDDDLHNLQRTCELLY